METDAKNPLIPIKLKGSKKVVIGIIENRKVVHLDNRRQCPRILLLLSNEYKFSFLLK